MNPNNPYAQHDIITIQNIDDEDFVFEYDRASGNWPYTVPAGEIRRFPRFLAQHAVKHLIDKILTKRDVKINNVQARQELASQIVVQEETFQQAPRMSDAERQQGEIDKLNKPSDLEGILGKKRQMSAEEIKLNRTFHGGNELPTTGSGTPPAPVAPEENFAGLQNQPVNSVSGPGITPAPVPTPPAVETKPVELKPEVDDKGNLPGEVDTTDTPPVVTPPAPEENKAMPSRSELADFAKNTLQMKFDTKTTKHFQETPVEQLVKEIDYPLDEQ